MDRTVYSKKIWFNGPDEPGIRLSDKENGVRILRIRDNEEVPDYLLADKAKSSSGLYQYENIFWSIAPRPNDPLFRNTGAAISKLLKPGKECKRPDMLEIYPIHLKEGDDPKDWAYLAHKLRMAAHQYKETLRLPLPLHLANKLEE